MTQPRIAPAPARMVSIGGRWQAVRCWCGRIVKATSLDGISCSEHDAPIPEVATAPSDPLTPGSVWSPII